MNLLNWFFRQYFHDVLYHSASYNPFSPLPQVFQVLPNVWLRISLAATLQLLDEVSLIKLNKAPIFEYRIQVNYFADFFVSHAWFYPRSLWALSAAWASICTSLVKAFSHTLVRVSMSSSPHQESHLKVKKFRVLIDENDNPKWWLRYMQCKPQIQRAPLHFREQKGVSVLMT